MSNTKHTPGPWAVKSYRDWRNAGCIPSRICSVGSNIVVVSENKLCLHPKNDAYVIAAAPEMLESMKALVEIVSYAINADILPFAEKAYAVKLNARRIIAKAEGADHAA